MNIYKVTVKYLEPSEVYGMVIAESPEQAVQKFKDATALDSAPPEYKAEVDSVELIEEGISEDITSMDDYVENNKKRTLN